MIIIDILGGYGEGQNCLVVFHLHEEESCLQQVVYIKTGKGGLAVRCFFELCGLHGKAFQQIISQDAVHDIGLSIRCVANEEIKRKQLRDSIWQRHAVTHDGGLMAVEGLQQGECHYEVPFFG